MYRLYNNPKLSPILYKSLDDAVSEIISLKSAASVARFFEIPEGQLLYILYTLPDNKKYKSFDVPKKKGGFRSIQSPLGGVSILLNKLKPVLYELYRVKSSVHGFVRTKSVVTNANEHNNKKYVLNLDLEDFFGSINFGRVRGLFMAKPFYMSPKAATIMAQLCTFNNVLPQGSPISPILSNFVAADLDRRLTHLANRYSLRYSRYADDITFSTSKKNFPRSIAYFEGDNPITGDVVLGSLIVDEISAAGFDINYDKVRMQIPGVRQEVTGLTVNEFTNVKREYIRNIRAMLHAWKRFGIVQAGKEYIEKHSKKKIELTSGVCPGEYFKSVFYGKLAYLKMVRGESDEIYMKFCMQAARLDYNAPKKVRDIKLMFEEFDVFICHASEDKEKVALPLHEACKELGVNAFIDKVHIKWGDSLTEKINHALGRSKFVIAILSSDSIGKTWPAKELNAALARELAGKQKVLPLIVGSPNLSAVSLLEDKLYLEWKDNAQEVAEKIRVLLND